MAIGRHVFQTARIVPVRFQRSDSALPANTYAPDPDDRGFTGYQGPIVGLGRSDRGIISVVRQLLDASAPLYVSSADAAKLQIISPAANTVLANGDKVDVTFQAGATDGDVKLRVHAQAQNGPIVGELTVHVSQVLTVHCAAHLTAIYAAPSTRVAANTTVRTQADIQTVMDEVNRQWRPAGVNFNVDTWRANTNMTNQVARNGVNPTDGVLLCPIYGTAETNENFDRLMATNRVANRVNIYFVRQIQAADPAGAGPNYIGFGSSTHRGMVISDNIGDVETTAHTVSHELGHILNLAGRGHVDPLDSHSDDDPKFDRVVAKRRHDLWSRRRLMYYGVGLTAAERTGAGGRYAFGGTQVGYGEGRSGHMITIQHLTQDPTDNEYTTARTDAATLP
jgi:hypothetical protein